MPYHQLRPYVTETTYVIKVTYITGQSLPKQSVSRITLPSKRSKPQHPLESTSVYNLNRHSAPIPHVVH